MTRNEVLRKMNITNIAYDTRHSIFKFLIIVSLFFICNSPVFAMLTATADRTEIYENETLELSIRYGGQAQMSEPDFGSLETDFEILSTNRGQQYKWSNGQAESYTDWNLTLLCLLYTSPSPRDS